jgi:hypothetical protein
MQNALRLSAWLLAVGLAAQAAEPHCHWQLPLKPDYVMVCYGVPDRVVADAKRTKWEKVRHALADVGLDALYAPFVLLLSLVGWE